jgi:CheY-like chemotaxis protein
MDADMVSRKSGKLVTFPVSAWVASRGAIPAPAAGRFPAIFSSGYLIVVTPFSKKLQNDNIREKTDGLGWNPSIERSIILGGAMDEKRRILVVDDEPGIVRVLRIKLKLHGYEVIGTTSGAEAVELARERQPDLILLDILMPGMTGTEVMERVRAFSNVPVIILTARPDIRQIAIKMGADDYLSKPFDPDRMLEKIKAILGHNGGGVARPS